MKKKLLLAGMMVLLVSTVSVAQKKFTASRIQNLSARSLNSHFKSYFLFKINTNAIADFTSQKNKGTDAGFQLELPGLIDWEFSIAENDLIPSTYTLVANTPEGRVVMPRGTCKTYSGYVPGVANSRVSLTIDHDFIYGIVKKGDKEYFIEPLTYFDKHAPADVFVVYDTKEIVFDPNLRCGVTETRQQQNNITRRIEAGTTCVRVELAIASDFSMFTRYGSASAVSTHNIGVMNNVIWDYVNNQFNENIEFSIVIQNVSAVSAAGDQLTPAYAGTDAPTILANFAVWGEGGAFGIGYDLAQFWTTRDIASGGNPSTVGLAYRFVGDFEVLCSAFKYHILEDFTGSNPTGSGYQLRVLASHEIGHNFGSDHDASGAPYIMAPSVQNTSTWSPYTVGVFNTNVPTIACVSTCATAAPLANFIATPGAVCVSNAIQLTDHSINGPTSWSWTMTGGTPATSTVRNPTVTYATAGIKSISLISTNGLGSSTAVTKKVLVSNAPATACTNAGASASPAGVKFFSLNNISKASAGADVEGKYVNNSCSDITILEPLTLYTVTITIGNTGTNNLYRFYIDYNNDGDFNDIVPLAVETVYSSGLSGGVGTVSFTFTTPSLGLVTADQLLRARIIAADFAPEPNDPCHNPSAGQVEDYAVYFASSVLLSSSRLDLNGRHQNGVNILDWKAYNEIGNNYFDVERSLDGISFSPVGRVSSRTVGDNNYTFTDPLVNVSGVSTVYYRLKMVELTGSFTYSKVLPVTIRNPKNELLVNLYPSPFNDVITATVRLNSNSTVKMQLMDVAGRIVHQDVRKLSAGINTVNYTDLESLSKGTYLVKIICENEVTSRLIQKQ